MAKQQFSRVLMLSALAASVAIPSAASAVDFNITGFVREEVAVSVTNDQNPFNDAGNLFNGRMVPNATNPAIVTAKGGPAANGFSIFGGNLSGVRTLGVCNRNGSLTGGVCDTNGDGVADLSGANTKRIPFNLFATRAEVDIQASWTDKIKTYTKIRAFYDGSSSFTNAHFNDQFETQYGWRHGDGNLLEKHSSEAVVDIPALYLDYNTGPFWVRVGQQTIAWGEAFFFRVFDVANGLDLRRHSVLDVGAEEFSDKRVASPAIRMSYTFGNAWEVDTFAQMFSPTVLPATDSPYNVVFSGFTWRDTGQMDEARNSINFGVRLNMPLTESFTMSAMAVSRVNPDGLVRWQDAPTTLSFGNNPSNGLPNPFCFGPNNGSAQFLPASAMKTALLTPLADGKCGSAGMPDEFGTASWQEWVTEAGLARLDPLNGARDFALGGAKNAAGVSAGALASMAFGLIQNPSGTGPLGAVSGPADVSKGFTTAQTKALLDAFFNSFNGPRGFITRDFKREQVFGLAGNYIVSATPGTWLDQLIVRGEVTVTPNKKFTTLSLSDRGYDEATEVISALILEKYQSIFEGIPATYLVFQWMHRTETDIFGRRLTGQDNQGFRGCDFFAAANQNSTTCGAPTGVGSSDYATFAFQQPFPNLIWRADFAMAVDFAGGAFFQPGLRYKPSSQWQFDLYANIVAPFTDKNTTFTETLDSADEVFARVSFFF